MAETHIPAIPHATLRAIVPPDGTTYTATATQNLWQGVYPFSDPSEGNKVTPFTTGKAYFSDLANEIRRATTSVYIVSWQVSWDGQLEADGTRVYDVLLRAVMDNPGLKVYIMIWNDTAPVQTYDDETKAVLETINTHPSVKRDCVFVTLSNTLTDKNFLFFSHHQKAVVIDNKIAYVGGMDLAYGRFCDEHYNLKANAEGREVLNRYNSCIRGTTLSLDPKNGINPNVVNPDRLIDEKYKFSYTASGAELILGGVKTHLSNLEPAKEAEKNALKAAFPKKETHQVPYDLDSPKYGDKAIGEDRTTLDPDSQPRMPWQDVHVRIDGPAVADVALNFVLRWKTEGGEEESGKRKIEPVPKSSTTLPPGSGSCMVQVLRSASKEMCQREYTFLEKEAQERFTNGIEAQANIADAMETLISKAEHYIYIENQFFMSEFGEPVPKASDNFTGPADAARNDPIYKYKSDVTITNLLAGSGLPQNKICKLLADRIDHFIISEPSHPFHVCIVLPVHPEGWLDNGVIMTQVYWTMQSLSHGSHSLLNRIRRSLLAKKLKDKDPKSNWRSAYTLGIKEAESLFQKNDIKFDDCFKYVTLLNLRNYEKLGTPDDPRYVTEQIYVHNKMMIVDDRYVLLGTANINDRSLLGDRDSEINVLVMDTDTDQVDLCGDGLVRPVRNFARKLRMEVWRKIFGMTAGGSRAASDLEEAVHKPGAQATWQKIQEVATKNTALYEAAFDFIPRNDDAFGSRDKGTDDLLAASIWPTWARDSRKQFKPDGKNQTVKGKQLPIQPLPVDEAFWTKKRYADYPESQKSAKLADINAACEKLDGVKGFITLLPYRWTQGENNNLGYNIRLVTKRDALPGEQNTEATV